MLKQKRKLLSIILTIAMILSVFSGMGFTASAGGGSGEGGTAVWDGSSSDTSWYTENPSAEEFTLSDAADLAGLASLVNGGNNFSGKTVTLNADIYLNSDAEPTTNEWTPIGRVIEKDGGGMADVGDDENQKPFSGTFDGGGHYIYNAYVNYSGSIVGTYVSGHGLFGYNKGTIKNLGVTGSISAFRSAGGIAAVNAAGGVIESCYTNVTVSSNGSAGSDKRGAGGIVDYNAGTIQYCLTRGSASNLGRAGGIAATNDGTINASYNVGNISSQSSDAVGGVVSNNNAAGTITNAYYLESTATVGIAQNDADAAAVQIASFDEDGEVSGTSLLTLLNNAASGKFIAPASGVYPVLSWQTGFAWTLCKVIINQPENVGTFTVKYEGEALESYDEVPVGAELTLTASGFAEGTVFKYFTCTTSSGTEQLKAEGKETSCEKTYTVSGDVTIGGFCTATALTVYTQIGSGGEKVPVKTITWAELEGAKVTDSSAYGYMFFKEGKWNVIGTDGFVTVDKLLELAELNGKVSDHQMIVAENDTGFSSSLSYGDLKSAQTDYKFYPNTTNAAVSTDSASVVPAGIAYSWGSQKATDSTTTAEFLLTGVQSTYQVNNLRFLYGTKASDLTDPSNFGPSAQGKRLASGITQLTVQTQISDDPFPNVASVAAASMTNKNDTGNNPYTSYAVGYDTDSQKVTVSASGLISYTNTAIESKGDGYWAGIKLPIGAAAAANIKIGSNFEEFKTVEAALVDTGNQTVSYYWDTLNNTLTNLQISLDGGATIYNIPVETAISQTVFTLGDRAFSMADLKAYESEDTYTCTKTTTEGEPPVQTVVTYEYKVTGITVADLLKHYLPELKPAAIEFVGSGSFKKTIDNYQYSWDDVMITWEQKDTSEGTVKSGLNLAVKGSPKGLWVGGLVSATSKYNNPIVIDGRYVAKEQLAAYWSSAEWTMNSNKGATTYNITGITVAKLVEKGFIKKAPATVAFNENASAGSIVNNYEQDWENVMLVWDGTKKDSTDKLDIGASGFRQAVKDGGGTLWWSNVSEVVSTAGVFTLNGVQLSDAQLKAYTTIKSMSILGKDANTMTGITVSDLMENYGKKASAATITFKYTENDEVKETAPVNNYEYAWDDVMVAWSMVDASGKEQISSGLREAVDGAKGKYWISGINGATTVNGDYLCDGVALTAADAGGTEGTLSTLLTKLNCTSENSNLPVQLTATNGTETQSYAADAFGTTTLTALGDKKTLTGLYDFTFTTTPADATVAVQDDETAQPVAAKEDSAGKTFRLTGNHPYSYNVSASGYTAQGDNLKIIAGDALGLAVALTQKSSGGGGGGGGSTKPEEKENAVLFIYTQASTGSTPVLVASYTEKEVYGFATKKNTAGYAYQYYKNEAWAAVVGTVVAPLDNIFSDAGVTWGSGYSLKQEAPDGFETTMTYDMITENDSFFDPNNDDAQTVVPAGLALEWEAGTLDNKNSVSTIASKAYNSGKMRFVMGTSEEYYVGSSKPFVSGNDNKSDDGKYYIPGYRLGTGITKLTVINGNTSGTTGRVSDSSSTTETSGTTAASVEATTTVSNGTASVSVTADAVKTGISAAQKAEAEAVVIKADTKGQSAATTSVTIPVAAAKSVSEGSLGLSIEAANGSSMTLNSEAMKSVAEQAGTADLKVEVKTETASQAKEAISSANLTEADVTGATFVSIDLAAGDKAITKFSGSLKLSLPAPSGLKAGDRNVVYQVSADGTIEKLVGEVKLVNGVLCTEVTTTHLSTFLVLPEIAKADETQTQTETLPFTDIDGHWAKDAIAYAYEHKLFAGVSDTEFAPNDSMTRAMLATVLYRMKGEPEVTVENPFTDVAADSWYTKAVLWAKENGIVDGYDSTHFGPNDNITREQLAAMLYRYAGSPTGSGAELSFTDASQIHSYAKDAVAWCVEKGIIGGMPDGSMSPGDNATRAQVAAMAERFVKATAE